MKNTFAAMFLNKSKNLKLNLKIIEFTKEVSSLRAIIHDKDNELAARTDKIKETNNYIINGP